MDKVIVDTDIIVDFLRTNSGLLPQLMQLQQNGVCEIYTSSITIMELFAGEMDKTEIKMLNSLLEYFKTIPFDQELARFAGEKKRGKKLRINLTDLIISITSVYFKAKLATRNKDHFEGIPGIEFFKIVFI